MWLKRRALNKYMEQVSPHLRSRYGESDTYTPAQIHATVCECGFSKKHLPYAYAIFLSTEILSSVLKKEYPSLNPNNLRQEIADRYFDGDISYSYKEVKNRSIGNDGFDSSGASPGRDD